jgi:hypothetical protein
MAMLEKFTAKVQIRCAGTGLLPARIFIPHSKQKSAIIVNLSGSLAVGKNSSEVHMEIPCTNCSAYRKENGLCDVLVVLQ